MGTSNSVLLLHQIIPPSCASLTVLLFVVVKLFSSASFNAHEPLFCYIHTVLQAYRARYIMRNKVNPVFQITAVMFLLGYSLEYPHLKGVFEYARRLVDGLACVCSGVALCLFCRVRVLQHTKTPKSTSLVAIKPQSIRGRPYTEAKSW